MPTILIIIITSIFIPSEAGVNEVIDELRVRGIPVVRFANTMPYKVREISGKRDSIGEREKRGMGKGKDIVGSKQYAVSSVKERGKGIGEVVGSEEYAVSSVKGEGMGETVKRRKGDREIVSEMLLRRLDYLEISTPQARFYVNGVGMSDTVTRYFQDAGLVTSLPGLDICIQPFIKFGKSNEYPNYIWRDIVSGDLRRAYGSMEFDGIDILLGRESLRWGPLPEHSFILSGTSPAFDLLYASYEYDFFKGSFFFTSLDPYILEETYEAWWRRDTFPAGTYKRFFSGHRFDFSLFSGKVLVGLSEVIIYSSEGLTFVPGYLNPFTLYYAYMLNRVKGDLTDNIGWGFDLSYYIRDGFCFYGELFIDDAQYGRTEENVPNMLAYRAGLKGAGGKNFWTVQYTRADTWTYIHSLYWNDFLFLGYPIGHPKGQDFDEIYGRLVHHLNYNWDITLDFLYTRKGENNFDNLWPGVFPEHQNFPSGTVEKSTSIEAGLRFFNLPRLSAELVVGYTFINNYHHIANETKWFPSVRIRVSLIK